MEVCFVVYDCLADHTPHSPLKSGRILKKKRSCSLSLKLRSRCSKENVFRVASLFDKALNGFVKGVIQPKYLVEFCDDENSFDLIFHPCNA